MPTQGRVPEGCREVEGYEGFLYIGDNEGLYDLIRCGVTKRVHVYPEVMIEDITRLGYRRQAILEKKVCSTDILQHLKVLCEMIYWAREKGHKVLIHQRLGGPITFTKDGIYTRQHPPEGHQRALVLKLAWKLYDYYLTVPKNFRHYSEWVHDIELAGHKLEKRYDDQLDVFIKMIKMKNWKKAHERLYLRWKERCGLQNDRVLVEGQKGEDYAGPACGIAKRKRSKKESDESQGDE